MKLLSYLKKYWLFALLAPLCMLGEVSMDLIQPKIMSELVDLGVLRGDLNVIVSAGLRMLGAALLGGVGGVLSGIFTNLASQSFANDLRRDVYSRIMHMSFQQTDKFTTGSLVTRLTNDITAAREIVNMGLRMFVRTGFMFVGGIIMMLSLDFRYAAVIFCSMPLQAVIIAFFLKRVAPVFAHVQQKLDKVNSVVQENVSGARLVKAYVREEYENERFSAANDDLMNTNLRVMQLMATVSPLMQLIMNISVAVIIYLGGAADGTNGVGSIMAAVNYSTMIVMSLMNISMIFQQFSRAKASADRITEVLDTAPVIVGGDKIPSERSGKIEFKNVSFHYPGTKGRPVLKGFNLTVNPGETVAILGETGAGKTSLVNLIPRFYDVTEGQVLVDGVDVREYDLSELRRRVITVMQKSELYSGTIADNIRCGADLPIERVIEAAEVAQADGFISSFADKYDTAIEEKGSSLSGGQKQRISIARAVIREPEILIFDDSTSALDLATEARLRKALRQRLVNSTVIMIAQRVAGVRDADKIVVIDGGRAESVGTHEELMQSSAVYREIYNSQMKGAAEQTAEEK